MKILVTGAAGAIGSHVAEALKARGHDVVGLDAFTDYYARSIKDMNAADLAAKGISILEKDLASDDLSGTLDGVEVVYHFAAQPGISASTPFESYLKNNIVATQRLVDAVGKAPALKLFVFISTSSVYGAHANLDETMPPQPSSIYGATKLAAEQLALAACRDKGLPVTVLRLFSVYGERERPEKLYHKVIRCVMNNEPLTVYEGSEKHIRSYTYVGDIVAACLLILNKIDAVKGEIFNIGTDKTITTGRGLEIIEEIIGKKIVRKVVPRRAGDQIETAAKIGKARAVLGYDPKVTPEEGLRREVEWYRTKLHK